MNLLEFTTYQDIRGALGVNDIEISDETLGLGLYSSNLSLTLDDANLAIQTKYEEVKAISVSARSRSQQRFMEATGLFATYIVAKQCCVSLPMFGPKSVSDSKTDVSRFNDSPYKETIKSIKLEFEIQKQRVLSALAGLDQNVTARAVLDVLVISSPSADPVTG